MGIKIIKVGGLVLNRPDLRQQVEKYIERVCKRDKVVLVVSALGRKDDPYSTDGLNDSIKGYLTLKERDRLKSIGETYAVLDVVGSLRVRGISAMSFSYLELGLIDLEKGRYKTELSRLKSALKENDIAVVPGFLARNKALEPTTLKREGSDLSAVLLARGLKEKDIYLVKDIKGIYDVRGNTFHNLSYPEFFNLVEGFSSPLSLEAVECAYKAGITLHLVDTYGFEVTIIK